MASKVTIKQLLKIDDKKSILNEIIDAGLVDADAAVTVIVTKGGAVKVISESNTYETMGILASALEQLKAY